VSFTDPTGRCVDAHRRFRDPDRRHGPWPFDRLRRVGATQEPVWLGPLWIHEERWEDLDRDLTLWGF
jgi:hypothetical protein